jgi:hypothetical protein
MEVTGQLHGPAALPPVPTGQEAGYVSRSFNTLDIP